MWLERLFKKPAEKPSPTIVDLIARDTNNGAAILSLIEPREWGTRGELLLELQEKLNGYVAYVVEGGLVRDFPKLKGLPVTFLIQAKYDLTAREEEFLRIVKEKVLDVYNIKLSVTLLPAN